MRSDRYLILNRILREYISYEVRDFLREYISCEVWPLSDIEK
jgi:hypothetical protein